MKIKCPACSEPIYAAQMNLATDIAVCSGCDEAFKLSALSGWAEVPDGFDINAPPPGAWFRSDAEGWEIGATTRSPIALFIVPFMCVWSGFSLGGIYGSQIVSGDFDPTLSLFGIPFLVGTLFLGCFALMVSLGRVQVTARKGRGCIFTGVGQIGYKRWFDLEDIERVEELTIGSNEGNQPHMTLALVGKIELRFAMMPTSPRKYYLLNGLRSLIQSREPAGV